MTAPVAGFDHLVRLSDDTGLLEHARYATPRREEGYCVDDNARGLVVVSRELAGRELGSQEMGGAGRLGPLQALGETYLALVAHAQAPDGRFHNRLDYGRRWTDEASLGDWWGRALWGLGTAGARHPDRWVRTGALDCFDRSAGCRSPFPRAMAFAVLGAAEVLAADPGHEGCAALIRAGVATIGRAGNSSGWPWPEPRLTYANAVLPEALIAAGVALTDDVLLTEGLDLLRWLLGVQTIGGHLSPCPVGGWARGDARPGFDQQGIEASAIADACARARSVTRDPLWSDGVAVAVAWFVGDNDSQVPMWDPVTGGGYDGLTATGCNRNQGAESTLAMLSTFQHGRARAARHQVVGG